MDFKIRNKNNCLDIPLYFQIAPNSPLGAWGLERGFYMTYKDKAMLYLLKKSDIADNDFNEHLQFIRYHKVDEVDYLELIIKKVRKDTTAEILRDMLNLLKV